MRHEEQNTIFDTLNTNYNDSLQIQNIKGRRHTESWSFICNQNVRMYISYGDKIISERRERLTFGLQ